MVIPGQIISKENVLFSILPTVTGRIVSKDRMNKHKKTVLEYISLRDMFSPPPPLILAHALSLSYFSCQIFLLK